MRRRDALDEQCPPPGRAAVNDERLHHVLDRLAVNSAPEGSSLGGALCSTCVDVLEVQGAAITLQVPGSGPHLLGASNAVMALMIGALIIHEIQPGPEIMTKTPELFWGLIASMWVGNAMLVILNLPLIGLWVKLLNVPYRLLYPLILLCCAIGAFSTSNNMFDVWVAVVFGFLGYIFLKLGCEPAPLLLGYILGPMLEENLRRALVLSRGDYTVFVTRPISLAMLLVGGGLLVLIVLPAVRRRREAVFQEP